MRTAIPAPKKRPPKPDGGGTLQDFKKIISKPMLPENFAFNLEAEKEVLGGLLFNHNAITKVIDILIPEAFYTRCHQELYRVIIALHKKGKPSDVFIVSDAITNQNLENAIGDLSFLLNLAGSVVSTVNIDRHAQLVMDKYYRRKLKEEGQRIIDLASDYSLETDEAIECALDRLRSIKNPDTINQIKSIGDLAIEVYQEIDAIQQGQQLPSISTGFYDLDIVLNGGVHRGDLVIVAARPSMGKTALAAQIATNIARSKIPALIFSLEMSDTQLFGRMLSDRSQISTSELYGGKLNDNQFTKILDSIEDLSGLPIAFVDASNITPNAIALMAREYKRKQGDLGVIVIDYLQLMAGEGDNRNFELSKITRQLKGLARELDTSIVLLSQLSREVEKRNNKRPISSDLRDSGAIEQDADVIAMLYRDEYYNPDTKDRGIAEVIVTKHRNGATGTVKLLFLPEFTKFLNLKK